MSGRRDPLEALAQRWGAAGYLVAILGTELLTMWVGYAFWVESGAEALAQLVLYVIGVAVGVFLWLHCPGRPAATGLLRIVLILAAALWLLDSGRRLVVGESFSPLWITVPLVLLMVWRKPPAVVEARAVVTALAAVTATIVVLSVTTEALGITQSWYVVQEFGGQEAFDTSAYWLPLSEALGLEGRWAGPFPHPNMAGPVGGFLLVVGLCRRGTLRWVLLMVGFSVLLLSASRTAMVGAVLGTLGVLAATLLWDRARWRRDWWVLLATAGAAAVLLVLSVGASGDGVPAASVSTVAERGANASGRAEMWPVYARIWAESPWWGSPDERVDLAIASGELPGWASTAHNLLLESLVRLGVVGGVLVVSLFAAVGVMATRAASSGVTVGIGLTLTILGGGITDSVIYWRLWAVSTIILFLAVIASVGPYPPARWPRRSPIQPEETISAAD